MEISYLKTSLAIAVLALGGAGSASAAVNWDGGINALGSGNNAISSTAGFVNAGVTNTVGANASSMGWTGNASLSYSAWGMQGSWGVFQVTSTTDVVINADSISNLPSFTLYRTNGNYTSVSKTGVVSVNPFNGNTVGADATANPANGAIHKFSQVAQAGDNGLVWATANNNSPNPANNGVGIVETLGYVNSATSNYTNSFGAQVLRGAHDLSIDNLFEEGIAGSVWSDANGNHATMTIHHLAAGFYNIFIGGAQYGSNPAPAGAPINLSVKTVPVPAAVWLFGSGLFGLFGASRKKSRA